MPVIVYEGANMHTLSVSKSKNIRLVPGKNEVSEGDLKALQDKKTGSDGFKHLIDNNEVSILDSEAVSGGDLVLANMNAKEIKSVVEAEADLDVLNAYLQEETDNKGRAGVIKTIEAQIDSLTSDEEKTEE